MRASSSEGSRLIGRGLFLLVYVHGYLAVPDLRISNGWYHAFSYSQQKERMRNNFTVKSTRWMILLLMIMLMPSKSSAITNNYGYQGTIEIKVGETKSISLIERAYSTVLLGYYPSGKWVLSDNYSNVSMISQNLGGCTIKGVNPGSKIKLTFSGNCILYDASWNYTGYYYITVVSPNVPVTSITLNTSSASLKVGDTKQLSATVSPSNATDKSVSWSSSNSSVASVSSSGLVTAKGAGTATITCRANDGSGVSKTCSITVSPSDPILVTSISNFPPFTSLLVGETKQLTYDIWPDNATDKSVTWSSSNSDVASVSSSGMVTAKGKGLATITCSTNDGSEIQVTCNVTVSEPVTININSTNFPDDNFRNFVLEQDYGKDGVLTGDEIKNIMSISVEYKNITSLKGIEYFTALKKLECNSNPLTYLDVSNNYALEQLDCLNHHMTTLDVSKNTALKELRCSGGKTLTSLDVSKNLALEYLWCGNTQLASLDVSKNTLLKELECSYNQLTALDVSKNIALIKLQCGNNQLTVLDVSKNIALKRLDCYHNQLTALDVSKNTALKELEFGENNIKGTVMDAVINSLPNNTSGEEHYFRAIFLPEYDTNVCTKTQLAAVKAKGWIPQYYESPKWVEYEGSDDEGGEQPTPVGLNINSTNFPDNNFRNYLLEQNYGKDGVLEENEIEKIDYLLFLSEKNIISLKGIEYFTALTALNCENNQLTGLDVSKNIALTHLYCNNNQLTALDVSKNTVLKGLSCDNNQLTSLDISNTKLEFLWCCNNRIKGVEMDKLISSLPQNTTSDIHRFFVIDPTSENEGNVCTKSQVAAIKAKGWTPLYNNGTEWVEYEGSEDASIATKISLPVSQTVNVGSTLQLTPTIEPATAEATLTWTTDDASIAKVTSTGVVFGSKEGTAIITVTTDNGLKAECFVMVQLSSGISSVGADSEDTPVYTLSGQRLAAPRKGINIVGGKKVIVR